MAWASPTPRPCSAARRTSRSPAKAWQPDRRREPDMPPAPDTMLLNARVSTLDRSTPEAEAVAIRDGRILAVGSARDVGAMAGPETRSIDAGGRRLIPGLNDSHTHLIRGGL